MEKIQIAERRRNLRDRRQKPTAFFNRHALKGRRAYQRRADNRNENYYVDRYGIKSAAIFAATLVFCVLDARITLVLLSSGATEANPFMALALKLGPTWFLIIKYAVTGVCLLALLVHKNFYVFHYKINVKAIIFTILFGYGFLVVYEIWLLIIIK